MLGQKLSILVVVVLLVVFLSCCEFHRGRSGIQSLPQGKADTSLPKEMVGKDGAPMVLIPAGEFQMGSDGGQSGEKPAHTVYLDAFYMDRYEVTNAQYRKFVRATGHRAPRGYAVAHRGFFTTSPLPKLRYDFALWSNPDFSDDDYPVVCVSWEDAKAYCHWAGKRLPTEAEWEKAVKGGVVAKQRFPWGYKWPPPRGTGNFADETLKKEIVKSRDQYFYFFQDLRGKWGIIGGYDDGYAYTAPVGSFAPNGYGLYDMVGNVQEWCMDWYDRWYYAASPDRNPMGPSSGAMRVVRGGSWTSSDEFYFRIAGRGSFVPIGSVWDTGFRCVQDAASRSDQKIVPPSRTVEAYMEKADTETKRPGGRELSTSSARLPDEADISDALKLMDELEKPRKIVYCLDVSASMAMGSKLIASKRVLEETLPQLEDSDKFNIVTFHSNIRVFSREVVSATEGNLEKAKRFLESITSTSIQNNTGTDILAALRYALSMEPFVIVIITDIQPTRGELDESRIAEEVGKLNKNNARIYAVGVEVWKPHPDGRLARLLKILTEQNGGKVYLIGSG